MYEYRNNTAKLCVDKARREPDNDHDHDDNVEKENGDLHLPLIQRIPLLCLRNDKDEKNANDLNQATSSSLGVWYLTGALACDLYHAAQQAMQQDNHIAKKVEKGAVPGSVTQNRGRRNVNLPVSYTGNEQNDTSMDLSCQQEQRLVQELNAHSQMAASYISDKLQHIYLESSAASSSSVRLKDAHKSHVHSVNRLLTFAPGVTTPPHADAAGYTVWIPQQQQQTSTTAATTARLEIQHANHQNVWYALEPPDGEETFGILMVGSHLQKAMKNHGTRTVHAPVHRVRHDQHKGRCALTLFVNADESWDAVMDNNHMNRSTTTTICSISTSTTAISTLDQASLDFDGDCNAFVHYLLQQALVPSSQTVKHHVALLQALLLGQPHAQKRTQQQQSQWIQLPPSTATVYWELQMERYCVFLELYRRFGNKLVHDNGNNIATTVTATSMTITMQPPRAIYVVWMSHMLQPDAYRRDCQSIFGKLLPHFNNAYQQEHANGCPTFHKLWKQWMGTSWPNETFLNEEIRWSQKQEASGWNPLWDGRERPKQCTQLHADLFRGIDSLSTIYNDFIKDIAPTPTNEDWQVHQQEYACFLVASSYAVSLSGREGNGNHQHQHLTMTPTLWMDLFWHAHQSEPLNYKRTMQELPHFVDHNPCDHVHNPPQQAWQQMTKDVWQHLFRQSPPVLAGHTLYCSVPPVGKPRGLQDHPEEQAAAVWWFPMGPRGCPLSLQGGLSLGLDDFPTDRASARQLIERFQGPSSASNAEQVRKVVRTMKEFKSQMEMIDRPSMADSVAGPLFCALTLGGTKGLKKKAFRLKKRRYEQLVKHFSNEMEYFGISLSLSWDLEAPVEEEEDLYGYEVTEHWKSPCIIFRPMNMTKKKRLSSSQQLYEKQASSEMKRSTTKNAPNTTRAWEFVEMVLLLQNRLHKQDPRFKKVRVIGADDMFFFAKRFFDQQGLFQTDNSATDKCDIGYHYTSDQNLAKIKSGGLLTKADRSANGIEATFNGSSYGDGKSEC